MKEFINHWLKVYHTSTDTDKCSMCNGRKLIKFMSWNGVLEDEEVSCDACAKTGLARVEAITALQQRALEVAKFAQQAYCNMKE